METDVGGPFLAVGVVALVAILIAAFIAASIAQGKERSYGGFFLLGVFFGPIAILVAILAAPGWGAIPSGRRLLVCPRCKSKQNVLLTTTEATCWRCDLTIKLNADARAVAGAESAQR